MVLLNASQLCAHISRIRNRWKEAARTAIRLYDITGPATMKQERVEYLLEKYRYLYEKICVKSDGTVSKCTLLDHMLTYDMQEKRMHPFGHPAIALVIETVVFSNKDGPARLFNNSLKPIPLVTLAFAAVTVRLSICFSPSPK